MSAFGSKLPEAVRRRREAWLRMQMAHDLWRASKDLASELDAYRRSFRRPKQSGEAKCGAFSCKRREELLPSFPTSRTFTDQGQPTHKRPSAKPLAVSGAQQTRSFELRAALDLARLYQGTGRDREARDLLAPALVGFTETPELPEIAEASRLLASLGGPATLLS